jgi:hypothetical protein
MKLKHDPFPLIFARGDEATKLACLEFFGLGDSPQAKADLLELVKQQHADGAFPSGLDPEHWGMRETARNALLLLKVGLPPQGVNVGSAVRFVLDHQNADGGWCENRALKIPPHMTELSTERSVTWIIADVVELLRQVGMADHPATQAALAWLKGMQNRHGGWYTYSGAIGEREDTPGDPDSSAQIAFLMGEIYGKNDPVYLKGRALFERNLDECVRDVERGYRIRFRDGQREELDAYSLTYLFLSWLLDPPRRLQSGYDASDPRAKRILEALADIQLADGGWRPFWTQESTPIYTALAVKVLVLSGMLQREDLYPDVKAYAG